MKLYIVIHVIIFSCLNSCAVSYSENVTRRKFPKVSEDNTKRKFFIDTDAGSDDANAILYMLGAERMDKDLKTVGISCVNGNTDLENVIVNVLKTLKTADRLDIPVYKGCSEAITQISINDNYFGKDGFGDFDYPDPPSVDLIKNKHAVNALVSTVKKCPGKISLLCLAPLTNIALAIRMYPKFLADVKEIFILGGAVEGKGQAKIGIEFNFLTDPESVVIVLRSAQQLGTRVILIPLETFLERTTIPLDWRLNELGNLNSSAVNLMNLAERKVLVGDTWQQGDQLLAAVAVNENLIKKSSNHPVYMETCGETSRGAVFTDYGSTNSTIEIIQEIDVDLYKKSLLKYLNY